jgi:transposase InsO family protein
MITRSRSLKPTDKARSIFGCIPGYNASMSKIYKSILAYSISDEAKFRLQVIDHFKTYGWESTHGAFKLSRATIFRWKRLFNLSSGQLQSLIPGSRSPRTKRRMQTDTRVLEFIKSIRQLHPRIGKDKIKPLLDRYCQALEMDSLSVSTIGKVIKRHNFYYQKTGRMYHHPSSGYARKRINYKRKVKRSPNSVQTGYVEMDTITIFADGIKSYVYQAIDIQNRFAFAYTYRRLNSQNTVNFLDKLKTVYPCPPGINTIQTDNGLEFLGDFDQRLKQEKITHLFIYPRCPKINGFVERANRSLREEFINYHYDLLADGNLVTFNQKLMHHLVWYNTQRPHQALKYLSPINYLLERYPESHMYVTRTLF